MGKFIKEIVNEIKESQLEELVDRAYVFPTRRACHYFREAVKDKFREKPFWSPEILTIEEFVEQCAGRKSNDEMELLFALYQVYAATYRPSPMGPDKEQLPSFDRFYSWGQTLLSDFDEVDRHLIDAHQLYNNLKELAELEEQFGDNQEMLTALKRFNRMMGGDHSEAMTKFSGQWQRVSRTYHAFKDAMGEELCFPGQLYRQVAEGLTSGTLALPYQKVVFAGFNALTKSEEQIFSAIANQGQAMFYWDADQWYMNDPMDEAGKFLRKYFKKWPPSKFSKWIITDFLNTPPSIKIIGGVHSMGQAQILSQHISDHPISGDCAIILADENLLFPVLYSLPEEVDELNVTMGYPLKHSLWFRLASSYLAYQAGTRGKGESAWLNRPLLEDLLSNPLFPLAIGEPSRRLLKNIQKVPGKWLAWSKFSQQKLTDELAVAITPVKSVSEVLDNLYVLLIALYQRIRMDTNSRALDVELAYQGIKQIKQLKDKLAEYGHSLELTALSRLLSDVFNQARVPFQGDKLDKLQIMGFLESRVLDFGRIYLLSANEGKLPKGPTYDTYIPYGLRKAFGLPTFEDQDAVISYHFKRVLQRAREINILYNTEVAVDGSGEKSRFLWQLMQKLPPGAGIDRVYQMNWLAAKSPEELAIPKSSQLLEMMHALFSGESPQVKALSPTAIGHYLDCSLRFYFRYILKIPEREQAREEMDARDFGNVVHKVLEKVYQPFKGRKIQLDHINKTLASGRLNEAIREVMEEYRNLKGTRFEGKDLLHMQIVEKLLLKVLESDRKLVPYTFLGAELEAATPPIGPHKIKLRGTLDRIHQAHQRTQIVDYKTGKVDLIPYSRRRLSWPEYIDIHFEEPRYKSGFQALFYGYLWSHLHPEHDIRVGVFPMKQVNRGVQWLNYGEVIPAEGFQMFERKLLETFDHLFDPAVSFSQTEDIKRCRFCTYREICQR